MDEQNEASEVLTTEQQFQMRVLADAVPSLSLEQAKEYIVEITRQMMVKDNLVQHLIKRSAIAK